MSDFEDRLQRALRDGAEGAPGATGLADGARTRLRARRRRLAVAGAAAAVVALAVPVAVAVTGVDDAPDAGRDSAGPSRSALGDVRVTCGDGSWPVSAMAGGVPDLVDEADVRAALAEVLTDAPMDAPQAVREQGADRVPYVALAETDGRYVVGTGTWTVDGPGADGDVVTLEPTGDGLDVVGWGDCTLTAALPPDRSQVVVTPPPGGVDPTTTEPVVLVSEQQCTSARDPRPHLGEPTVVEDEARVLVTVTSDPVVGGADCPGNPSVPLTLELDEPLGDRELLDAGTWPPTPLDVADVPAEGWRTVVLEDVALEVPAGWSTLDTSPCEFAFPRIGPPSSDPCGHGETVALYGSATFDAVHGPGLRSRADYDFDVESDWTGYVYTGDWAVNVSSDDRDVARRVLASARPVESAVGVTLDGGWRTHTEAEVTVDLPPGMDAGLVEARTGFTTRGVVGVVVSSERRQGWVADHLVDDRHHVSVTAPTQALAELVASTARVG